MLKKFLCSACSRQNPLGLTDYMESCKMVLTFSLWTKAFGVTILWQYFHMVLFVLSILQIEIQNICKICL